MAASQLYVGATTSFGVIVQVTARVDNSEATVRAKDGSTKSYKLPFLIAHGVRVRRPKA